jgi:hypothetical protein
VTGQSTWSKSIHRLRWSTGQSSTILNQTWTTNTVKVPTSHWKQARTKFFWWAAKAYITKYPSLNNLTDKLDLAVQLKNWHLCSKMDSLRKARSLAISFEMELQLIQWNEKGLTDSNRIKHSKNNGRTRWQRQMLNSLNNKTKLAILATCKVKLKSKKVM